MTEPTRHLTLVTGTSRVVDMKTVTTACETETCGTCHAQAVEVNEAGECRPCATFAHNLRLMSLGITRDKATGRYAKVGKK